MRKKSFFDEQDDGSPRPIYPRARRGEKGDVSLGKLERLEKRVSRVGSDDSVRDSITKAHDCER